jgi:hypothetical protein
MGSIFKNSGIFDMISNIVSPVNQQPTTPVATPVTPVNTAAPMSPIRRFNAVVDPRLSRTMSRPMFRTSRYDGAIDQLLERLGITSLAVPQQRPDVDQLGRSYNDPRYYKMGGRVNYQDGGSSKTPPKFIPMDMESVAKRLFGRNLDNLTYNEKQTIYDYIEANRNKKANGGRIGYAAGTPAEAIMSLPQTRLNPRINAMRKLNQVQDPRMIRLMQMLRRQPAAMGGIMNLKMGGIPVEMDLRAKGGFVPIGKKERADDVPARLSKNEFVFTAKAVRNAGNGDIREGARKMYNLMNKLEARK